VREDRERLLDILEAIAQIEKYAVRGKATFEQDELIQNWIVRRLQIIGEACRALTPGFRDQHPEVSWADVIGMRNILVHDYFGIDSAIVWSVVEDSLPALKSQVKAMLEEKQNEENEVPDNGK
jgi:uncharacterized protein with HEPN domain